MIENTTVSSRIFSVAVYILTGAFALFCLAPFWLVLAGSFTNEASILKHGYQFFPKDLSLDAFQLVLSGGRVAASYKITLFVTVVGTLSNLLITTMLAYPISSKQVKYRNHLSFYVYFTMLFSGGVVPWYILISTYLHLQDTIGALIIPYLCGAFNVLLMKNFFRSIPDSLTESARMDGAHEFRILFRIVLPLSLPVMATITLFVSLVFWNDFGLALWFIDSPEKYPLQYLLYSILQNVSNANTFNSSFVYQGVPPAYSVRMATCIITIGPIILLYPYIQKYFIKGLTIGSVKD